MLLQVFNGRKPLLHDSQYYSPTQCYCRIRNVRVRTSSGCLTSLGSEIPSGSGLRPSPSLFKIHPGSGLPSPVPPSLALSRLPYLIGQDCLPTEVSRSSLFPHPFGYYLLQQKADPLNRLKNLQLLPSIYGVMSKL